MFGYVLAGVTALAFGGIALRESLKKTSEKVKDGDTVFVESRALRPTAGGAGPADEAALQAFLSGFLQSAVKVVNVSVANDRSQANGTIVGFPKAVFFPLAAVQSIERGGRKIV